MAIVQEFDLNMIPDSAPVIVHVNQYDEGEGRFEIHLFDGNMPYVPAAGAEAIIQGTKPDGKGFDYTATLSGSTVTADVTKQMTAVAGVVRVQVVITEGDDVTGTFVFGMDVQRSGLPADTDMSASDYQIVEQMIETAKEINANPPKIGENGHWWVWNTTYRAYIDSGVDASISINIASITMLTPDATPYVINTGTDTDPIFHLFIPRGIGISSITKTGTQGLVDTYTITYSDGYTTTFNVTNGKSAYQSAVEGGYDRTEAEFNQELANFKDYADGAAQSAEDSEAWATGMRDGSAVPSTDPTYHNNSKYYSEEADGSAEDAEAWAVGERGGVPVPATDPTYHNNSKYWSERSAGQTLGALQDVNINNPEEGQGLVYDETAEKWVNGKVSNSLEELEDTLITNPQDGESLVYDETEEKWVNRMATTHFITKPTVSGNSFTYNGTAQGPTITGLDADWEDYLTITHRTEINAGTYTLTISIKNTQVNCWNDLTTQDITYEYTISKAAGEVTVSPSSVTLDADHLTAAVTVSGATGNVTISSSNTAAVTVSPASITAPGGTVTLSSVDNTSGTSTITFAVAASDNHLATSKTITARAAFTSIYGVEWDGTSSSAMSRTDDAADFVDPSPAVANGNGSSPFDNLMPWSGMQRVTDANGGVLVKIPKFWFKLQVNDTTGAFKLQIADSPAEGFSVSPAHMDRGDGAGERDFVYVGAYHCSNSDYKSTSGVSPKVSTTRANFRTAIHNLGSDIWQWDKAMLETIQMLYLVEYADWNSQAKIGYGCSDSGSVQNSGLCDAMVYHTGTNAANRTTYGHVRYRYIEDLWANVYDWLDGIYLSSGKAYVILNPANFSDTTGGVYDGFSATLSGNEIKRFKKSGVSGLEWFYWPVETISNSAYDTYICDYGSVSSSSVVVRVGGYYDQFQFYGLFYQNSNSVSVTSSDIGSRLQKLPAA